MSSTSGTFALQIENSEKVDIEGQAFDVINNVNLTHVKILNLAAAAFKPNVQLSETITKISLRMCSSHVFTIPEFSILIVFSRQNCLLDKNKQLYWHFIIFYSYVRFISYVFVEF